jgi:hypothetical protein
LPEKDIGALVGRQRLAVQSFQLGLVVERIDLAQTAAKENVNGPPGFRIVVRRRVAGFAGDAGRVQQSVAA